MNFEEFCENVRAAMNAPDWKVEEEDREKRKYGYRIFTECAGVHVFICRHNGTTHFHVTGHNFHTKMLARDDSEYDYILSHLVASLPMLKEVFRQRMQACYAMLEEVSAFAKAPNIHCEVNDTRKIPSISIYLTDSLDPSQKFFLFTVGATGVAFAGAGKTEYVSPKIFAHAQPIDTIETGISRNIRERLCKRLFVSPNLFLKYNHESRIGTVYPNAPVAEHA